LVPSPLGTCLAAWLLPARIDRVADLAGGVDHDCR
jgi:hypothetical protein